MSNDALTPEEIAQAKPFLLKVMDEFRQEGYESGYKDGYRDGTLFNNEYIFQKGRENGMVSLVSKYMEKHPHSTISEVADILDLSVEWITQKVLKKK